MASINLELGFKTNVKILRLKARLGPGSPILPINLWLYAGDHCPEDGRLALLDEELESICEWWGEKGACAAALIDLGFVRRSRGFFKINDWLEHSGHLAAFKERALKANQIRWDKYRSLKESKEEIKESSKESPNQPAVQDVKTTSLRPSPKSPPPKSARSAPPDAPAPRASAGWAPDRNGNNADRQPAPSRAAVVEADQQAVYTHQDFIRAGWRNPQMPTDNFGWTRVERSMCDEHRVMSKLRETGYKIRNPDVGPMAHAANGDDVF